jgi:hypothetical protein
MALTCSTANPIVEPEQLHHPHYLRQSPKSVSTGPTQFAFWWPGRKKAAAAQISTMATAVKSCPDMVLMPSG